MPNGKVVGHVEDMGQFMGEVLTRLGGLDDRMKEQCEATRELRVKIDGRDVRCQTRGEVIATGAVRSKLSLWLAGITVVLIMTLAAVLVRHSASIVHAAVSAVQAP